MAVTILQGDVREQLAQLPADHCDCVVTSPPYWGLRDYGTAEWIGGDPLCVHRSPTMRDGRNEDRAMLPGSAASNSAQLLLAHNRGICGKCGAQKVDYQIGLEPTLGEHLAVMVDVFRAVRRVLKPTGTCWINYGDCYATSPNGRSAADTKEAGGDDRTFRDKPFSTIGAIYEADDSSGGYRGGNKNLNNASGRVVAGGFLKAKDLCMVPNRLAIALQDDGWWVRSEIIWHKPNPMPESAKDRPTSAHEKVFLLTKSERYFYDHDAVRENRASDHEANVFRGGCYVNGAIENETMGNRSVSGNKRVRGVPPRYAGYESSDRSGLDDVGRGNGRNLRNVWSLATRPFPDAHFATFPPELAETCIKAGSPAGGLVLDPFGGAGTTGLVAQRLGRACTLIELNPDYVAMARRRIDADVLGPIEATAMRSKGRARHDDLPLFGEAAE